MYIIPFPDTNVNRKWLFYIKHFHHLPPVVISSHSPISLTAAIAQSSTATMIAVRIVFPIFITFCPLFCIHYTTLSSSTKVYFSKTFLSMFCTFITFLRHLYHSFSKIIFYDIDKKYICDIMDTRGDKNEHDPKHISAQA